MHEEASHLDTVIGASPHAHKRVVAAVIERTGTVLICRRPEGKNHGGMWEFPGGKINTGESLSAAVSRELQEELEVRTIAVGEAVFTAFDDLSGYEIHFLPVQIAGEPVPLEHSEIRWCLRRDLLNHQLAPSDFAFATFLLSCES